MTLTQGHKQIASLLVLGTVFLALLSAGCGERKGPGPIVEYKMKGEVVRLETSGSSKVAVVKHERIEGWMEAMTMGFPVRSAEEFAKLKDGARITATVKVQDLDYWLENIQVEK